MAKERTASFYIGEDQWHCTTYPISEISKIECKSEDLICRAYGAWAGLCGEELPLLEQFDPAAILRKNEAGRISRIDTTEDPQHYKVVTIGPGDPAIRRLNLENPFHRHGVLMEILECKETRQPIYQEVKVSIRGKDDHKLRLLLPFANNDGSVAAIFTACCPVTSDARKAVNFASILR